MEALGSLEQPGETGIPSLSVVYVDIMKGFDPTRLFPGQLHPFQVVLKRRLNGFSIVVQGCELNRPGYSGEFFT